jgi:hypothetical protein
MVLGSKKIIRVNMKVNMFMVKKVERENSLGMMAHIMKVISIKACFLVQEN